MGKDVFANGMEISAQASDHKCIAAFPDVCLSPPSPAAGPLPVPYPNTSYSRDLKEGTKDVVIGGKPICREGESNYKSSPLGDEASTKTLGMNIVDHGNAGKTYCQAFSMDVKVEKLGVTRTLDLTTSNHVAKQPGGGAMTPQMAGMNPPGAGAKDEECPCCHGPLHENQKDDSGNRAPTVSRAAYYQGKRDAVAAKSAGFDAWAKANPTRVNEPMALKFGAGIFPAETLPAHQVPAAELARADQIHDELTQAMADSPDCPNVHSPADQGCGTHFATPTSPRNGKTPAQAARDEFTKGVRNKAIADARAKFPGKTIPNGDKVNHITPLDAGGCPVSMDNLIPDGALDPKCKRIDDLQSALQGRK